ncbi:hypothetical protein [uncultured Bacteroides sp.]
MQKNFWEWQDHKYSWNPGWLHDRNLSDKPEKCFVYRH